jgi:hypothetical protein
MRDSLGRYCEAASLLKHSLVLLLTAAAVRPAGAQASASTRQFSIPFAIPGVVNEARMIDSSYVDDAMAYKYRAPQTTGLDLYVWPMPLAASQSSSQADQSLRAEVIKFRETLPLGRQRGWYDDYRIAFEVPHPVALASDSVQGYAVALAISRGQEQFIDLFYIYALDGMFVKIRLTVPAAGWNSNPVLDVPMALVRAMAAHEPK